MKQIILTALFFICLNGIFASEVFIRVNQQKSCYAMIGLQTINSSNNIFKFHDVSPGNITLSVYSQNTNFTVGTYNLFINPKERIVCEIDAFSNINILERLSIFEQNWYTTVIQGNSIYNNSNFNDNSTFAQFLDLLKKESFDSGKLEEASKYATKSSISAKQIAEIALLFTFDSNRLDWAKKAYASCYDKQNYFLLKETFKFNSSYSELEDFMEGK